MEMFRDIFADAGLPQDLVYMAHVESGYKTTAYSRARARGIFQFIASTARLYGLRVDSWVDERADPVAQVEGPTHPPLVPAADEPRAPVVRDEAGEALLERAQGGAGRASGRFPRP